MTDDTLNHPCHFRNPVEWYNDSWLFNQSPWGLDTQTSYEQANHGLYEELNLAWDIPQT